MSKRFVFHREALARSILEGLAGAGILDYSSGLFLAAPRRTGKSTFLREDLVPQLEAAGWLPVYIDLWSNKQADPGQLIEFAIVSALQAVEPKLKKTLKAAGVDKINILRTVSWDLTRGELPEGATLTDALQLLRAASEKPVVLVVDEAQHALNSENGLNAMFALKAARDALNQAVQSDGLRLIFTGSSRDKLAQLVLKRQQPFFGATITPFPLLGDDFVEAYTHNVNDKLADKNSFHVEDMKRAFQLVGHRPELLASIVQRVAIVLGEAPNLGRLLEDGAIEIQADIRAEYEAIYGPLTPVQKAVLEVLAESSTQKKSFAAYSEATITRVREIAVALGGDATPTAQTIQAALEALREKELVWRSGWGAYALEDSGMADWLSAQRSARTE
ncbi:MAG: hypothetical protein AB7E55_18965 [Pigmentiphaga sp.]